MRLDATERRLQEANEILQAQIAERKRAEGTFKKAKDYTKSIAETICEPLIVLTADLRIINANRSFYDRFHVTAEKTEGRYIYSIGDDSWILPHFFYCEGMDIMIT